MAFSLGFVYLFTCLPMVLLYCSACGLVVALDLCCPSFLPTSHACIRTLNTYINHSFKTY